MNFDGFFNFDGLTFLTTLVRFGNKICFEKLKVILREFNGFLVSNTESEGEMFCETWQKCGS